ncbi:MAG: HigA family addiction module antitoxin [Candidatus Ornithospirochaeta sp.]
MEEYIALPTVGEILKEEFMDPNGISQYKLAKDTGMPISRIQDIIHGRRKVTADTSLRLGIYFGVSEKYFLDIQIDIEMRELKRVEKDSISKIVPLSLTAGIL